jgi:hypothetical protein
MIHEEFERRLNSGDDCYHSVQDFLFSRMLSKNLKIRMYKSIILPVVLHGCETWFLILKEEYRMRVLPKRVLRRIFGTKRDGVTGGWRKLHNEELHNLFVHFTKYNENYKAEEDEVGGACGTNEGEEERVQVIGKKARGK